MHAYLTIGVLVLCSCASTKENPGTVSKNADEVTIAKLVATSPNTVEEGRCQPPGEFKVCTRECKANNQKSCAVLGIMALHTDEPENIEVALALLQRSCEAKVPLGCGGLGSLLMGGIGTEQNIAKGRELLFSHAKGAMDCHARA
ncbi:MAG: hypothetical protein GY811_21835 [Myxococcales bacterium]|nr:hypothetical protein [Myxococcales bacterium]